jgi:hypothetical protein
MRAPRFFVLSLLALPLLLLPGTVVAAQDMPPEGAAPVVSRSNGTSGLLQEGTLAAAQRERRRARQTEFASLAPAGDQTHLAPATIDDGFESSGFAQFMSSPAGRILRVVAGAGMIAGGIAADSDLGTGIAIAGAVPLLAGAFDFCVLSPLFGGPLSGKAIRAAGK